MVDVAAFRGIDQVVARYAAFRSSLLTDTSFPCLDDVHPVIHKHLLQTSSSHIADLLFLILSNEFLPGVTVDAPITEEVRNTHLPSKQIHFPFA